MSTRPGVLCPDDLTAHEQADMAARRVGALDALIHDCEALPAGWRRVRAHTPAQRYARALAQEELVGRIGALGDVGYLDN